MIRASGGRATVKVSRQNTEGDGIRAYLARDLGPWIWTVPAPKGHPRPPKLETLHGQEHTMEDAVRCGLARLAEIYGTAK
ncbi:hypothetical protein SEA_JINKIES_82 [Arthrobacter phage Jinkies]|uniref:Uncharacterized protein n=1 Tax=Arthrobacter phage Jinkies TaxID=2743903 RepID=A0A7T0IFG9_9CAUD|nr:hypothetical protein SEA_JINKIES_82 [Arthrobacter phage Jinkies]